MSRFIDGVSANDFAGYHELLISAAKNYDAKNGPTMCLQNRRANTHMFSDSEYDNTIEPYSIDMAIDDNFGMNTGYGRYGAAYNMVGLIYFNDNFRVFG